MGMPGFSGFPAELTILIGAWRTSPVWAAIAALGILVAAAFTLRAIQVSFFGSTLGRAGPLGPLDRETSSSAGPAVPPYPLNPASPSYPPITLAEKTGALLLVAATVLIGLQPDLLLDWILPSLQSPLFQAAFNGGAP
jgi:NADH-quinone oxidoreductase subunit M